VSAASGRSALCGGYDACRPRRHAALSDTAGATRHGTVEPIGNAAHPFQPGAFPMDITTLLKKEHDAAVALAKRMSDTDDGVLARKLLRELMPELLAHAEAEEAIVYTALRKLKHDEASDMAGEGVVEHGLLEDLLRQLDEGRAGTETWKAKAKVLHELLEHHVEEENKEMLPLLRQHHDAASRSAMGERFLARKEEILQAA
jgi:hemerythrin-like domain-containing protein